MDNSLYKVIVVDDEIWALRGLCNITDWNALGFSIIGSYTSSSEALDEIVGLKPDVVFTDIRMPGIDGMDLIESVHNLGVTPKIVIVSAYRDFDVAKKAISKDVSDYLMKPLDKKEVAEVLERLKLTLDKERSTGSFDIMHFDLSQKKNLSNDRVLHHIEQFGSAGFCRLAVSDKPVSFEGKYAECFEEVYIKGYKHSYLCRTLSDSSVVSSIFESIPNNRYGISRTYQSFRDIESMLTDVYESYSGCFVFSDNPKISDIQMYLSLHYDEKHTLPQIAERFFVSESYLFELFRKYSDTSVLGFVKNIRLNKAAAMLLEGGRTIGEIADIVGYPDLGYFGKLFKAKYGCTPEQYATVQLTSQT